MSPQHTRLSGIFGGILIGGGSTRMGTPKHLLRAWGRTFLERVVAALEPCVARVVLLGRGELPESCRPLTRLEDPPGLAGPLAGILAAMRWNPAVAWLIAACDLPLITPDAVGWLLAQRAADHIAVLPRITREGEAPAEPLFGQGEAPAEPGSAAASASRTDPRRSNWQAGRARAGTEPLLAVYEPQARRILEELAAAGRPAPRRLAEHSGTFTPTPPPALAPAWRSANTPADLAEFRQRPAT